MVSAPGPGHNRPNVALITVDCWRGDHIGMHGRNQVATPNLDRLASESTWFSNASTCGGWTQIAMTALMSSTYSSHYDFAQGRFEAERPCIAAEFSQAGYATAGVSSNPVCGSTKGFNRGFDHFADLRDPLYSSRIDQAFFAVRGSNRLLRSAMVHRALSLARIRPMPPSPSVNADAVVDEGLRWLDQPRQQPWFLWLHFMDLHWPYESAHRPRDHREMHSLWQDRFAWRNQRGKRGRHDPGPERARRWRQLYREQTEQLDTTLGRLFDTLRARHDWDATHVAVTSDHGEEFFEHGTWAHSWNQLHREGTHVPLLVRTANSAPASEIAEPVSHIDVAPTILDLAGIDCPAEMLGSSLTPALQSGESIEERPVRIEMHGHRDSYSYRLAIVWKRHRYIYEGDRDRCRLFNLEADPGEDVDLYSKHDSLSRSFDQMRLGHISTGLLSVLKGDDSIIGEDALYDLDADPEVLERLRALGYLD